MQLQTYIAFENFLHIDLLKLLKLSFMATCFYTFLISTYNFSMRFNSQYIQFLSHSRISTIFSCLLSWINSRGRCLHFCTLSGLISMYHIRHFLAEIQVILMTTFIASLIFSSRTLHTQQLQIFLLLQSAIST